MKRRYLVVYEKGKRNYSGFVPDVPGCVSTGKDLDDMRAMMREALEFHLEGTAEDGNALPESETLSFSASFEGQLDGVLGYVVEWLEVKLPRVKPQSRKATMRSAA